ncbi:hypothetical protein ABIB94_008409 [Bradyrhizobium sp. JR7.2]|uniref:Uncharacterized protein n=1 Tax=Bradyrhizobium barranii TaxID=2992140 RepID=A0ABY3QD63_9BRAD|nr:MULTISPECIES: hypothetical protein [Bradyrhizobium]UFW83827.1 hypothetical protein BjapCC829_28210 [Bradyrhizobium japonicum]
MTGAASRHRAISTSSASVLETLCGPLDRRWSDDRQHLVGDGALVAIDPARLTISDADIALLLKQLPLRAAMPMATRSRDPANEVWCSFVDF